MPVSPRRRARAGTALVLAFILAGMVALPSTAEPPTVGATGSMFEILDGNTVVDNGNGYLDWDNVDAVIKEDQPSGQNDDSFGNGTKEDTAVPSIVTGSIPPNKSDLKEFGYYVEDVPGEPGFLHLFWTRVQDPSGTTNMDFEFNDKACTADDQSGCSANGVTPIRTVGDLLITYDLSRGGTQATISLRTWNGTAWGPAQNLDPAVAVGSINTEAINTNINGIPGTYSPRTFGEATVNLAAIFDPTVCQSFGGAYLKSRASDSFTAALKDFIAPIGVDLANCGRVVVHKVDDRNPPQLIAGAEFTIDPPNAATPPTSELTEVADGVFCMEDLLLGNEYTITESVVPDGYEGSGPQTFTPMEIGSCTGVNGTIPDLTFVNTRQRGSIVVQKEYTVDPDPADLASFSVEVDSVDVPMTPYGDDLYCLDDLLFGTYTVTEDEPDGFEPVDPFDVVVDSPSTCDERIDENGLVDGEEPDATISNEPLPVDVTVTKYKEDTDTTLAGFAFTLKADGNPIGSPQTTGAGGTTTFEELEVGVAYEICETDQPSDWWTEADPACQPFTLTLADAIAGTYGLSFENAPLADVDVVFHDHTGYTTASVSCVDSEGEAVGSLPRTTYGDGTPGGGNGELNLEKLALGEYTCTIDIQNGADHSNE
jgi:hypothetical protein